MRRLASLAWGALFRSTGGIVPPVAFLWRAHYHRHHHPAAGGLGAADQNPPGWALGLGALRPSPGGRTMMDSQRRLLRRMVANEADMSFKRRSEAAYDFLALEPGDRLLDMGSGRGFYLNFTRRLYPEVDVVGVEIDLSLLEVAKARVPGCRVINADAAALPFPDGHFDKVLFTEVIEHVPDDRAVMAELYRVLAPGGVMALTTPNADYPMLWDPINKVLEATVGRPIRTGPLAGIWANHVRLYTVEGLARLASESGFEVSELRACTRYSFPFIHNLVYGIGKPLLERGALPGAMCEAADRFNAGTKGGSWLNPVRLGLTVFNAVDRLNDLRPATMDHSFLIIAQRLVKPGAVAKDDGGG